MTAPTNEDWGIDPADWQVAQPALVVDEVFAAKVCVLGAAKILDNRIEKLQRARALMRRAYDMVMGSIAEMNDATRLVEEALRELAKVKDGSQ